MDGLAKHWINGAWVHSSDMKTAHSINPSTGEVMGTFADGGLPDVQQAIQAARHAFDNSHWAHKPRLRAQVLLAFADAIEAEKESLAQMASAETGTPISGSRHEVAAGIGEFRYYAGLCRTIFGRVTEIDSGLYAMLAREPVGVAGIIVPWNAPVTLLVRSLAPALAAGCTAVVKAAGQSALTNHAVFQALSRVEDLPAGVLNMLAETGSTVSKELVASPDVDIISYTGSTATGKLIMEAAASTMKRLSLELGGSAPVLVFEDADIDRMAPVIATHGTIRAGQMCTAASRLIVHRTRVDEVQDKLARALGTVRVGLPGDPQVQMGPMIDVPNRDRIYNLITETARHDEVLVHGTIPDGELAKGAFILPSLVAVRSESSPMLQDEVFGPALSVNQFDEESEAITKANDTRYGLAASVWSKDMQRAQRVATKIRAGTVWINGHNRLMAEAETGGYKESGIGRLHGVEGLDTFLHTKHISWHMEE